MEFYIKIGKRRLRIRFIDIFTLVMLAIIYTLVGVLQEGGPLYNSIQSISTWWRQFGTSSTNILLIAFLISIIGNSSVMIVIPYALVIYSLSITNPSEWVWIALLSGVGAALGEAVSYLIGRLVGSAKVVSESEVGEKFLRMRKQFERNPGTIPFIVFIFAASPLPDDMILVPMGLMKYPYYKTILPCVVGKTVLTGLSCFLGFLVGINSGNLEYIRNNFWWGNIILLFKPSETVDPRADLISFSSVFIFIWIFLSINYDKMSKRRSPERKKFEKMLLKGGNFTFDEWVATFEVVNKFQFRAFLKDLAESIDSLSRKEEKFHIDPVVSKKVAYRQSMQFVEFFFSEDTSEKGLEEDKKKYADEADSKNEKEEVTELENSSETPE